MKTLRNTVSAVGMFATVCCGSARQDHARTAAVGNYAQGDVNTISDGAKSHRGESLACVNVSDAERTNPFQGTKIVFVSELRDPWPQKGRPAALQGATVYILAAPGLTKEWLGHLLECHMALPPASTGPDPLVLGNSTAEVESTANGFSIDIRTTDGEKAQQILRTAEALLK